MIRPLTALALLAGLAACSHAATGSAGKPAAPLQELTTQPSRKALYKLVTDDHKQTTTPSDSSLEIYSLYGPFAFPTDAIFDVKEKKPRENAIFGVDLSHYTPDDFPIESLRKREVLFAYLKATQGTGFKDGKFASFWNRLGKLAPGQQVHRGAYHFLSAGQNGADQATTFVDFLALQGGLQATDLPPVMDLEWDKENADAPDRWAALTPDQIVATTRAWLTAVQQKTGRKPMIYTSWAWWKGRIGQERLKEFADTPLWIADYSESARAIEVPTLPAGTEWTLWQFTESATMAAGYDGDFDANIFKGSTAQFYQRLNVQPFAPK
jgi:lysozyme